MLRPRLIPCLLVSKNGLVKTLRFGAPKYVGSPINAVRIFNEKEVDELTVLHIDATRECQEPDYRLIAHLAAECRMPLCYGGGVRTVDQVEKIIGLGVEKVAIGAAAVETPRVISESAARVGSQSVVVVMDIKAGGSMHKPELVIRNGSKRTGLDPIDFAREMERRGVGEIIVQSVDRDGTMGGYDLELAAAVREAVSVPLTILGGAGTLDDARNLFDLHGPIGAGAGSMFVFKGKLRAVLITYPNREERTRLWQHGKPRARPTSD